MGAIIAEDVAVPLYLLAIIAVVKLLTVNDLQENPCKFNNSKPFGKYFKFIVSYRYHTVHNTSLLLSTT